MLSFKISISHTRYCSVTLYFYIRQDIFDSRPVLARHERSHNLHRFCRDCVHYGIDVFCSLISWAYVWNNNIGVCVHSFFEQTCSHYESRRETEWMNGTSEREPLRVHGRRGGAGGTIRQTDVARRRCTARWQHASIFHSYWVFHGFSEVKIITASVEFLRRAPKLGKRFQIIPIKRLLSDSSESICSNPLSNFKFPLFVVKRDGN